MVVGFSRSRKTFAKVLEGLELSTYEKHVYRSTSGSLPFRLWRPMAARLSAARSQPAASTAELFPLLLFLHGAGERGTDNEVTLVHGARDFASDQQQWRHPSFVVIPQCPTNDVWASIERTHEPTVLSDQPSASLASVQQLIRSLQSELPIDRQRIYLTGLSMGGYGAWDLLMREPEVYAAAVVICGGADCRDPGISRLARQPLWVFHGDQDEVVPVARSREAIDGLRARGGSPRYTEYVGGDHDSWTETYRNPEVWDWLFAQKLEN
jgi:predicted peptidase